MIKTKFKNNSFSFTLRIVTVSFLIMGCGSSTYLVQSSLTERSLKLKRCVVYPFKTHIDRYDSIDDKEDESEDDSTRSENTEKKMFNHFFSLASESYDTELIPFQEMPTFPELFSNYDKLPKESPLIQKGMDANADAIIIGRIFRFRDRIGGKYSIERPASVAFDILIFSTSTGQLIWKGQYDETQLSLSENLFRIGAFITRRGQWVTAEELMKYGLKEILKQFPKP